MVNWQHRRLCDLHRDAEGVDQQYLDKIASVITGSRNWFKENKQNIAQDMADSKTDAKCKIEGGYNPYEKPKN
jgi:hypothetical protein